MNTTPFVENAFPLLVVSTRTPTQPHSPHRERSNQNNTWQRQPSSDNDGMIFRLILLFTIVPFVELVLLLQIHHFIAAQWGNGWGLLITLGSIVVTGIAGAALARQQGLGVLRDVRQQTGEGRVPGQALADGILVLIGAAFLLTPGFLTDFVGFSFLIPASRALYRKRVMEWFKKRVRVQVGGFSPQQSTSTTPDDVFVVEPIEKDSTNRTPSDRSLG